MQIQRTPLIIFPDRRIDLRVQPGTLASVVFPIPILSVDIDPEDASEWSRHHFSGKTLYVGLQPGARGKGGTYTVNLLEGDAITLQVHANEQAVPVGFEANFIGRR